MSELKLSNYEQRPYGQMAKGTVTYGKQAVQVCVRTPAKRAPRSGFTYVLPPGWTEEKGVLGPVAREAVKLGHTAVTLSFTNRWGISGVLTKNADDIAAVLDALPEDDQRAMIGHSGAGSGSIRGARKYGGKVRAITTVAPAEHLAPQHRTFKQTARHICDAAGEPTAPPGEWRLAMALRYATAHHIGRRPFAVGAEAVALLRGDIEADLQALVDSENAPDILRLGLGDNDLLFPLRKIHKPIRDLYGDEFIYPGGHCTFLNDAGALGARILGMDAVILGLDTADRADNVLDAVA